MDYPPQLRKNRIFHRPPPPPVGNSMLPPPPKMDREEEKDWDDAMSVATSGGLPALSVYEVDEEQFRREALLEGRVPSEFMLSVKCTTCAICSTKFTTVKEGLEHFRKTHYKKRCPKCFMVFASTGNIFKDHLTTHFVHSKSRLEHIQCVYCVEKIYHYEDLWDHLESDHLSNLDKEMSRISTVDDDINKDPVPKTEDTINSLSQVPVLPPPQIHQENASHFESVPLFTQENVLELCMGKIPNINVPVGPVENPFVPSSSAYESDSETVYCPAQKRKCFSDEQKNQIIRAFLEDPNSPWDNRAKHLSQTLKCDYHKISTWFTSARSMFVKGHLPMWAKSPAGLPMFRGHLLPNGRLQIVSTLGKDAVVSWDNVALNEGENNELLEKVELAKVPSDSVPAVTTSSEEIVKAPSINHRTITEEAVKIKVEKDVGQGSGSSSGYESDDTCITSIIPSKRRKGIAETENQSKGASIPQKANTTKVQSDISNGSSTNSAIITQIKIEKEEEKLSASPSTSAKENVTEKKRRASGEITKSTKINTEKERRPSGDITKSTKMSTENGISNSCGYESDDSCVTQVFLPEKAKVIACFKQWKASMSEEAGKKPQNEVTNTSSSKSPASTNKKSEEIPKIPIKLEKNDEVTFKQPANIRTTEINRRKSVEEQSESRKNNEPGPSGSNVMKRKTEESVQNNFKRPCLDKIPEMNPSHRKSFEKCDSRENEREISNRIPVKRRIIEQESNPVSKRRPSNNENCDVEEETVVERKKINSNSKYVSKTTSQKNVIRQIRKETGRIGRCEEKSEENIARSIRHFKIPKKSEKEKSSLEDDRIKNVEKHQKFPSSTIATRKSREFYKPASVFQQKRVSTEAAPLALQQQPLSINPIPTASSNPGPSSYHPPTEINSKEIPMSQPIRQRRTSNNDKILEGQGVVVLSEPPTRRRKRRCRTPIGQRLAPVNTTMQLKQSLKERQQQAIKERQEKYRQELIAKRKEEFAKELALNEKKAQWAAQREKFFTKNRN